MKSQVDFQEQQQQHMQQQITELLAQPMFPTNPHMQEHASENYHKRYTPMTLTAMTNLPECTQMKGSKQHGASQLHGKLS
jgi:hypothetical protein